jgi:two-component system, sensor histidine kinase and response regulator
MLARGEQREIDHQKTRRMIHTLKGVAGVVRADRLAVAAEAIEYAIKDGHNIPETLGRELEATLKQVREGLDGLPAPQPAARCNLPPEDITPAMRQFLTALRAGELVEDDLLNAVAGYMATELGSGPAEKLRHLVDNFAQDEAAALLLEVAGTLGLDLGPGKGIDCSGSGRGQ